MAAAQHGKPVAGATCMSCWNDVDEESKNYVEYQAVPGGAWLPSGFCSDCVTYLLQTQWGIYTAALAKVTCKAEQRRLLERGPPINLKDAKALPVPDDPEAEVHALWFVSTGEERNAKLDGSLEGEARKKYWDEQLAFQYDEPDGESAPPAAAAASSPSGPASPLAPLSPGTGPGSAPHSAPGSPVPFAGPPQSPV